MRTLGLPVRRAFVTCIVGLLMLGAAACGDSENSSEPAGGSSPDVGDATSPATATDSSGDDRASEQTDGGQGQTNGEQARSSEPGDGNPAPAGNTEQDRVANVVTGMYEDLSAGDAAGACAAMSRAVREQVAENVLGGSAGQSGARTCERSLSKFIDAAAGNGLLQRTRQAKVQGVRIDGGRAVVTVSIAGNAGKVQLLKEQDEWRFGAPPVAGPK
jgi:hypothetical protein